MATKEIHRTVCDVTDCETWEYSDGEKGTLGNTWSAEFKRKQNGWKRSDGKDICPKHE